MFASTAHSLSDSGFDRIVSGFYDAATGGSDWGKALVPVQQLFGARAVVLHTTDIVDGRMLSLEVAGPSMERCAYEYVADWERHDPRKRRVLQLGVSGIGQWLHTHDVDSDSFIARNGFYRHFLAAHEVRQNSLQLIGIDERTVTAFAIELHASRGPLDPDERELARRFGVHLEGALLGHERVRRLALRSMVGHHLLQAFAYPMWLLDIERGVQYANEAALAAERGERPVHRLAGRFRLADSADDRRLSVKLHELLKCPHNTRRPLRLTAVPGGADAAWLHLAVLDPQQVMGLAFGPQRCVLATLFTPQQVSPLDPFALAQMFELTPTEARVAALLGEGQEPAAIAERLNVKVSTVRTHVRQVLAALGQQRMTDVVRVLRQGEALWAAAGATKGT